ncbi:hypothetical protein EZV62_000826 [Acer yangbiense]|uniref:GAG-pre-integrase domain-containing protein n=1 Tax=Acer yangbiense TaxID=1000413 RepID=A0A5C7IS64_9ROSI|nr:hypothetical protein EZV62_000826 [Acer yangbiense]
MKKVLLRGALKNGLYRLTLAEASQDGYTNFIKGHVNGLISSSFNPHYGNKTGPGNVYKSRPNVAFSSSYATVNFSIWHAKLGHPAPLILQKMLNHVHFNKKFVVPHFCDSCKLGKLHKLPYAKGPLDLIYSDIWGPAPALKSDALDVFINFQRLVELQFEKKIKNLSDMGGEYIALVPHLTKGGIQIRTSPTPCSQPSSMPFSTIQDVLFTIPCNVTGQNINITQPPTCINSPLQQRSPSDSTNSAHMPANAPFSAQSTAHTPVAFHLMQTRSKSGIYKPKALQ